MCKVFGVKEKAGLVGFALAKFSNCTMQEMNEKILGIISLISIVFITLLVFYSCIQMAIKLVQEGRDSVRLVAASYIMWLRNLSNINTAGRSYLFFLEIKHCMMMWHILYEYEVT